MKASQDVAACVSWWCWGMHLPRHYLSPLSTLLPWSCVVTGTRRSSPDPSVGERLNISSKEALAEGRSPGHLPHHSCIPSARGQPLRDRKPRRESASHPQRAAATRETQKPTSATTGSTVSGGKHPLESPPPPAQPRDKRPTLRGRLDRQPAIRGSRRMRANTARIRRHEKAGRTPIDDHQPTRRHSMGSAPQHAPPPAEERQQSTQRRLQETPTEPSQRPTRHAPRTPTRQPRDTATRHRRSPKPTHAPHPTDAADASQTLEEKPKERHQSGPTRTHKPRTTTPKNTANAQRGRNATNRKRPTNKVKTEDSWGQVIEGLRLICSLAYDVTQSHAQDRVRTTQNTCAILYTIPAETMCNTRRNTFSETKRASTQD